MSDRSLNWLKFGALVSLAFVLGLFFAGLLDLPQNMLAQDGTATTAIPTQASPARHIPGAQPLSDLSDAFAAVVETVRPSVVFITSSRTATAAGGRQLPPGFEQFFGPQGPQRQQGSGSGFIVSPDGYILTNNHVVEGADKVEVALLDHRTFVAKVVGTDPLTDLAVIKIDAKNLSAAALGQSESVRVGEWVLAVGNPLGDNLTFTVTSSIVSAKGRGRLALPGTRNTSIQDFIQTDAAINPGNSGGPLLNVRGEVIGINSAIASQTGTYVGYGFAIPIDLARNVMEQIVANGKVQRAALGVQVIDATAEDAEYVGLKSIRGVMVSGFTSATSPAKRAGLEEGDVIISIDGKAVEYTAQLQQEVGFRRPGELVKVEVARKGGVRKTINVALVAQESAPEVAANTSPDQPEAADGGAVINNVGITVEQVNQDWIRELDLQPNFRGLVVRDLQPDSPAEGRLQGLASQSPDIIVAVENIPVRTEAELRSALQAVGSGGVVTLMVYNPGLPDGTPGRRAVRLRLR
ncbi:MAG: Do family serine endopeptidase [Gemmatimonadales bacterium]|nr:MAG: Do family serine endopeptidase [Gemmatimonadales bacterium]